MSVSDHHRAIALAALVHDGLKLALPDVSPGDAAGIVPEVEAE